MRKRFMQDDDGHWYLISADQEDMFNMWVEAEGERGEIDFDAMRISGSVSSWTFEKAREDQ